ncbi:MAG: CoA transferase [Alphaproteobacteria bacterium]|nr:CoA transferase [Alphaproteobacteria bacterium]
MGALDGLRVLDLSRILAGPSCTQILGDLGADVIKIERPGAGDDTRKWGPPYLADSGESAYYLSANRNKRSVTIDIARPEGQALLRRLLAGCDVLIENFKVGDLARHGLGYEHLAPEFPRLVYCSITGFGQTGPYAQRAGYDFLAQGMGGMMSLTGEPSGDPVKVGIGNADLLTGMYAAVSILAALRHRDRTGQGQRIDLALLDSQLAWMTAEAENFLISGQAPKRRGNAHPNIVPYEVFPAADGWLILAVGNDAQFRRFCQFAECPELAEDQRFATNSARVVHREDLIPRLRAILARHSRHHWLNGLEALGVPAGPVNTVPEAFADPQVRARGMRIEMPHPLAAEPVPLVASPINMSGTPPEYRRAPPVLGQHTDEVLDEFGLAPAEIAALRAAGVI